MHTTTCEFLWVCKCPVQILHKPLSALIIWWRYLYISCLKEPQNNSKTSHPNLEEWLMFLISIWCLCWCHTGPLSCGGPEFCGLFDKKYKCAALSVIWGPKSGVTMRTASPWKSYRLFTWSGVTMRTASPWKSYRLFTWPYGQEIVRAVKLVEIKPYNSLSKYGCYE